MSIIVNPRRLTGVPPHRRWALQLIPPSSAIDTTLKKNLLTRNEPMSFNGFVFNFINDLKVTINVGGGRRGRRTSFGQSIRGFVAVGLLVCLMLIVVGLAIAGATAGIENPPPMLNTVYVGFVGAGLIPGMFLFFVYSLMGGGKR